MENPNTELTRGGRTSAKSSVARQIANANGHPCSRGSSQQRARGRGPRLCTDDKRKRAIRKILPSGAAAPVGIEQVMVNRSAVVADGRWCGDGVMAGDWIAHG